MPLALRASLKLKNFNLPVSYRVGIENRFNDSANVYTNQNVLETRNGIDRWNTTAFSTAPLSVSFFKDNENARYLLVKDQGTLYVANATGAHTSVKAGLTASSKHRGVTFNNRHILALGSDGLFQFDGTTVTQLGQAAPTGISAVIANGGTLTDANIYQVGVTFYDSTNGFESNGYESDQITTANPNKQINITSIPTTAANANIDKVRIYLKDVTGDGAYLFIAEINLGTASYSITDDAVSTVIMPSKNGLPPATGKYLAVYGQCIAVSGVNAFPSDVFISEDLTPDGFDDTTTSKTFNVAGNGPITGVAVGYYAESDQLPYIVAFKKRHIELYTEISGSPQQIVVSDDVGCLSHDTIKLINGDIYFMSANGWHVIQNGKLVKDKNNTFSLDNGDINDIFTRSGFVYELNQGNSENFFSVFYPTLKHYMTFVSEAGNTSIYKSYNYEFDIGGFRPFTFPANFKAGCEGEDSSGDSVIFLVGSGGYVYTYSIKNTVGTDIALDGTDQAVEAFFQMYWLKGDDLDASYNFGPLILRALSSDTALTVKFFENYSLLTPNDLSFSFSDDDTGFILDVSELDEGILGNGLKIVRYTGEIFRSTQALLLGFYKSAMGESMSLIEGQVDFSKNGNPN
jgi:hypothetical protein